MIPPPRPPVKREILGVLWSLAESIGMTPKVLEFIDAVCKRPAMYVGRHRFDLLVAYLEGYAQGLATVGDAREEMAPLADLLERFRYWHAERFDHGSHFPWSIMIEHAFPDEDTRFAELARRLRECAAELGDEAKE
jgi:hypothetical protein